MATITLHHVDDALLQSLKIRANQQGQTEDAVLRQILLDALAPLPKKTFAEVLAAMPNVGLDTDFERHHGEQ